MKIYVASSWRNKFQPEVVRRLTAAGHEVYDFRHPAEGQDGFHWYDIDPDWQDWTPQEYRDYLHHPLAEQGFLSDMEAMQWADVFVGVQPFGMEMGWAVGQGKKTILLLENGEPELMVKMFDYICCSLDQVVGVLEVLK
jgi:hypothetical protein